MKTIYSLILLLFLSSIYSCQDDVHPVGLDFVAAFENKSIDYSTITDQREIALVFSKPAEVDGTVYIEIQTEKATDGVDFDLFPLAQANVMKVPFKKGDTNAHFLLKNLIYPFDRSDKKISFHIQRIEYEGNSAIQGNTQLVIAFGRSVGGSMLPDVGGPTQPNQVFIHLSKGKATKVKRDSWDFGFYNGDINRVILNGSIYMAAKALDEKDINKVTRASVKHLFAEVAMGTFDAANEAFVDSPTGDILKTAIQEIDEDDSKNPVYLVNMGFEVGNTTPPVGTVAIAGDSRGWMKVQFLKRENKYAIRYAELNATSYTEKEIERNTANNFTSFSLKTNSIVPVEPPKAEWDLCFTVFTNIIEGSGTYGYSDFVVNNIRAGIKAYQVQETAQLTYKNFNETNIDDSAFKNDQRVIGSDWRDVFTGTAYKNKFYVIKDAKANYYKIKMLEFLNAKGERGYPKFEYQLIK